MRQKLLMVIFTLLSTNVVAQSLVAHWDFEPANVTLSAPFSQHVTSVKENINGWIGTAVGIVSTWPGTGPNDHGLRFGGPSATYIQVPHDPKMDLESWTIVAQVSTADYHHVYGTQFCQMAGVVWKGEAGSNGHYSLQYSDNPYDLDCQQVNKNTVYKAVAAGQQINIAGLSYNDVVWQGNITPQPFFLPSGQGYHCIVGTYDHTTQILSLYIDGILHVSTEWKNQFNQPPAAGDLFFGNSDLPAVMGVPNGHQFIGSIADVKIYDGAMSPADVRKICGCQNPSLVARWDFNSGNINETIQGWSNISPTPPVQQLPGMDGSPNGAMKFNRGDYLQFAHDPLMNLTDWTIVARVRPDNFDRTQVCQSGAILWRGTQWSDNCYALYTYDNAWDASQGLGSDDACNTTNASNFVFAGFAAEGNGNGAEQFLGGNFNANWPNLPPNPFINWGQWYCVILSYNSTQEEIKVYIDGRHVATKDWENGYGNPMGTGDLFIGSSNTPGGVFSYFFDGAIDDIQLFDGVFCPGEIPNLCCDTRNLIGAWDFANGATKELINGWTSTTNPTLSPVAGFDGTANEAVHFDRGEYLQFPHDPLMDLTSWSITAIVKPTSWDANQLCQVNTILNKGTQWADNCYALYMYDNAWDNNCNTYSPNNYVFAGFAAGTNGWSPSNHFLGGASSPGGPIAANPFIVQGQWHCVGFTYDGTAGRLMTYVNGIHVATKDWPNQYGNPMTPGDLFIGSGDNTGGLYPYFFEGDIDEIKLYSGVLCQSRLPNCERARTQYWKSVPAFNTIEGKIGVMPNPAANVVNITAPENWQDVQYTITNSVGTKVLTGLINGKTSINVSNLSNGLYMVITQYKGQTSVQKLVIQH